MDERELRLAFWEDAGLPSPGEGLSTDAYMALPETGVRMELTEGRVVYLHWSEESMSPAPSPDHQEAVLVVAMLLTAMSKRVGGSAHMSPVDVVLPNGEIVQPDVIWRAQESACIRTDRYFQGAPELAVEVLSAETAARDRSKKFDLYQRAGVQEYWLVDARDRLVEVYSLGGEVFRRIGAFTPGDEFNSPVFSRKIPAQVLFRNDDE